MNLNSIAACREINKEVVEDSDISICERCSHSQSCYISIINNEVSSISYRLSDIVIPIANDIDSSMDNILKLIDKI